MIRAVLPVLAIVVACGMPGGAGAQDGGLQDRLEEWEARLGEGQALLNSPDPSAASLDYVRADLARQRSAAQLARDETTALLAGLRTDLEALGPPPGEGVAELPEVARQRQALSEGISVAQADFVAASKVFAETDTLIAAIDRLVLRRFSTRLVAVGPSPLAPANVDAALAGLGRFGATLSGEVRAALSTYAERQEAIRRLPAVLTLLAIGLGLMFVVRRRLADWLIRAVTAGDGPQGLWGQEALTLMRLAVPALGSLAVIRAIGLMGLAGPAGQMLLATLPTVAAALILAYWIGHSLFSPDVARARLIALDDATARRALRLTLLLGGTWALAYLANAVVRAGRLTKADLAVLEFPVLLATAWLLFRLVRIVRPANRALEALEPEPGPPDALAGRVLGGLRRLSLLAALAGPVLAAVGLGEAARLILMPTVLTLALAGAGFVLFSLLGRLLDRLAAPVIGAAGGLSGGLSGAAGGTAAGTATGEPVRGLLPVIAGFVIVVLSVPLLALIWGARWSDIVQVWVWLGDGIRIGDARVSAADFVVFAAVFGAGYVLTRFLQSVLRGTVLPRTRLDVGGRNAVLAGVGYVGIFLAALLAITTTGLDLSNLAIVAGALSVGVGFGLQTIVSNFVSGIILLVERPIKEGDWIEVAGFSGNVASINVRATTINTFDRATVIVPNQALIAGSVLNRTHSSLSGRLIVPVKVIYGADPRRVEAILKEIAEAHPAVMKRPAPFVVFNAWGVEGMEFEIRCVLRDVNQGVVAKSDMNFEIIRRLREAGIELPYGLRMPAPAAEAGTGADMAPGADAERARGGARG
jgi:small-conductance mechanosensitive channel